MFRDVPACSRMFHVPGFIDAPGSKVIIPDPKLSRWIQSFYSLFKVIISDPKLLLRIQTYYSGSQSYYPGSKVIALDKSYYSGSKVQYYSGSKVFLRNCKFGQCEIRRLNWALVLTLFVIN